MTGHSATSTGPAVIRFERFDVYPEQRRLVVDGRNATLRARAFDVLLALLNRRDRVVSTNELLEAVWPGLVVEENNLCVQVAALRKLIGRESITTIPGRGYRLTAVPVAEAQAPPAAAPPESTLLGRDAELEELRAAVEAHALVTLAGAGGIGKTTLARAFLRQMRDAYPDGVGLVELAPLTDAALVAAGVGAVLGLPASAVAKTEALVAHLAARSMLIVLDNCEQVVDGAAALARALHVGAPGVRLLATSQVSLRLPHEHLIRLGALALPTDEQLTEARRAGAVALFAARAAAADSRFALDERNIGAVVEICRRLDGIPLAIELAAARIALLGVEGLRSRLGERFRLLTVGARAAPARQQTLRAALDWSHNHLSRDERAVFRRLGVFLGSFSLPAVQAIVADDSVDEWTVLDLLGNLIDRSLVTVLPDADPAQPGVPRYRLLETMRDYARTQLHASGEFESMSRRHAEFFVELAQRHGGGGVDDFSAARRTALSLDHANLRACMDWSTERDLALAVRGAEALMPYWRVDGHHAEALQRGEAILTAGGGAPYPGRQRLLNGLCALAFERGLIPALRSFARQAAIDSRAASDLRLEAKAISWEGHACHFEADQRASLQCYERALSMARALDDQLFVAETLGNIGTTLNQIGDAAGAVARLHEALGIFRAANHHWGLGFVAESLGEVAYAQGDFRAARAHWLQSVAEHRVLGHAYRIVTSLQRLGCAEHRLGRHAAARDALAECLTLCDTHGFEMYRVYGLAVMARVAADSGEARRAARLFGAVQQSIDALGLKLEPPNDSDHAQALAAARRMVDSETWNAAWRDGETMPPATAMAIALAPLAAAVDEPVRQPRAAATTILATLAK